MIENVAYGSIKEQLKFALKTVPQNIKAKLFG